MVKKNIKRKMIAGIDKEELVLLKFTKAEAERELEWEHSKEFEYKREMYDIVESQTTSDSVLYWCWWDYEETNLNLALSDLVEKNLGKDSKRSQKRQQLLDFYKNMNTLESSFRISFHVQQNQVLNTYYQFYWNSKYQTPLVPPPQLG